MNWISERPIRRRKLLDAMAGGVLAAATRVFISSSASAESFGVPPACTGSYCPSCSGSTCTSGCNGPYVGACIGDSSCWSVQGDLASPGCYNFWQCCDWDLADGLFCVCRGYLGVICQRQA